jgi:hypothetical protein
MSRLTRRLPLLACGVAMYAAAAAGLTATGGAAEAADGPGSFFQSLSLTASAGGERFIATNEATHEGDGAAEADIPIAETALSSSFGRALASVVWPGTLAGNGGSTLLLIDPTGGKIPSTASKLNDPVRAEAQTGGGAPKQTNASVPGTVMSAEAHPLTVSSTADVGSAKGTSTGVLGTTHTEAASAITGLHSARSDASSRVENFAAPGNAVTIGSVVSVAHTTTDGVHATAAGSTTISNARVAGIPVTIDDKGVHVKGSGVTTKAQNASLNKALTSFQMQIYLVNPSKRVSGGTASFDAGGVMIDLGDGQLLIYLGGAQASSAGVKGHPFRLPTPPPLPTLPPTTSGTTGGTTGGSTGLTTTGGSGGFLIPGGTTGGTTGGGTGAPAAVTPPVFAAPAGFAMPKNNMPAWIIFAIGATFASAAGLRRLPDKVLTVPATTCPDGDRP